jgi:hypothetical protein
MKYDFCNRKNQVKPRSHNMKRQLMIILFFTMAISSFSQKDTIKTKVEFKPSGKLWGYAFGDFLYKAHTNLFNQSNTQYAAVPKDFNSLEFRRIYLGYDYDISEHFSTQFLLAYEGTSLSSDGNRSVYIKIANLRWKNIIHNSDLVIGAMAPPTFAVSESVWSYRSLEKTIMDMRKIGSSNDVGISLQGKLNDEGDYGYNFMISNGSGAKPETDRFKKFYANVYAKFLDQKIILDLGVDDEWTQSHPNQKSKATYKVFLAYQTKTFAIGVEAFQQVQKNNTLIYSDVVPPTIQDTVNAIASGVSIFARGSIIDKLGYFLRYDYYNPDSKFNVNNIYSTSYSGVNTESFLLAGLDYTPVKNVHFMPNVWYDLYKNRYTSVNNLTEKSNDLSFRLTVYYIFK